jgi:hypothetical protein
MSLYVIVYIGVASTETDILFCEKKLSSKKIVKNLKFNLKKKIKINFKFKFNFFNF